MASWLQDGIPRRGLWSQKVERKWQPDQRLAEKAVRDDGRIRV
jgi:hypothetical protein